ncbi:MAG: hypothetical protein JWP11_869 [Frankiales bacterium]|nr:hypothetical protein [Frankiales bacterium]
MRRGLVSLGVALGLSLGTAALLLVPSRVHVASSTMPQLVGQTQVQTAPAQTLDCGSVISPGPQWSSEGGTCQAVISGRRSDALAVGVLASLAVTTAAIRLAVPGRRR